MYQTRLHIKMSHVGWPEGQLNQGRWESFMNLSYIYENASLDTALPFYHL